jgi:CRP-like cAMP-binding protein
MTAACHNQLLAILPATEQQELGRNLRRMPLRCGTVLHELGSPIDRVVFPESGVISLVVGFNGGETVESAAIGADGAVGGFSALHRRSALCKAIVQAEGSALVITADKLRDICGYQSSLYRLLRLQDQLLYVQAQQTAACNAAHPLEARLCRCLLRAHDLCGPRVNLTQEMLAASLGVRRTSVSLTAHALQNLGIIRYRRGAIEIRDLDRLRKVSCECHEAVQMQRARLLQAHEAFEPKTERPLAPVTNA